MSKTIVTIILAVFIVAGVSYGFYVYTRPVVAPTANTNTVVTNSSKTNSSNTNSTATEMTKIYLVALEDNGKSGEKIGCGDSLVAVDVPDTNSFDSTSLNKVKAAVTALLAIKEQYYGESGLYSALYQSNLTVNDVTMSGGDNVEVSIDLTGTITSGGACDGPRITEQLVETVRAQASNITTVNVSVDGVDLAMVLSGAGQ